jgi:hypothetical protein
VAAVAEHFEVLLVVEAGDGAVLAAEGLDVVHLEPQLVAGEQAPAVGVASNVGGPEAAALTGVPRLPASPAARVGPDVFALELAGVRSRTVGGPATRQRRAAGREAAARVRKVDASDVVPPG